jgi:MATE family multidrug resistance protein
MVFMTAMGVGFLIGRRELIEIFNQNPAVVAVGARLLVFAALFQIFDAMNMVLSGVLRGAGDTRFPMITSLLMAWVVFVPLVWLLCVHFDQGAAGGWFAALVWIAGLALVLRHRFVRGKWMDMLVVERTNIAAGINPTQQPAPTES